MWKKGRIFCYDVRDIQHGGRGEHAVLLRPYDEMIIMGLKVYGFNWLKYCQCRNNALSCIQNCGYVQGNVFVN
jgi:hypothetical protein